MPLEHFIAKSTVNLDHTDDGISRRLNLIPQKLAVALGWSSTDLISVQPISGGRTNFNYEARYRNEKVLVRFSNEYSADFGIDRSTELEVLKAVHQLGLSPKVVFSDSDCFVFEFISGVHWNDAEMLSHTNLACLCNALRQVHELDLSLPQRDILASIRSYTTKAIDLGVPIIADFSRGLGDLEILEGTLHTLSKLALCHNDLNSSNILFSSGRIRIIDWAYAGAGDPFYDLGKFCTHHHLNREESESILKAYQPGAKEDEILRFHSFRALSAFWSVSWCLLRSAQDSGYLVFADEQLRQFFSIMEPLRSQLTR